MGLYNAPPSRMSLAFAIGATTLSAQTDEAVDAVAVAKIRDEAFVIGYPQAWTPGTNGLVTSEVVDVKIAADGSTAISYTRKLLNDRNLRLKKLGEEAVELAVACVDGDRARAPTKWLILFVTRSSHCALSVAQLRM